MPQGAQSRKWGTAFLFSATVSLWCTIYSFMLNFVLYKLMFSMYNVQRCLFFLFFTVRMYQHHASQSYIWNQQKPVLYIIASSQLYIVYIYSIYVRRTPPCAHHIRYYRTLYCNRYYITYTYMYEQLIWRYNVYLHLRTADIATIQTYISYCYYLTIRNTYSKQL